MKKVKFRVTELCDSPKQNSDIQLGGEYIGEITDNGKQVYYTDTIETDWVFYVGDTCELIND